VTRQTWTALVSAGVFIGLAVLLVVIPVPFVTWGPGGTRDTLGTGEPLIQVDDVTTYPTTGRLDMTVVTVTSADGRLSLPQALLAYWLPHRDTLPRTAVYPEGKPAAKVKQEEAELMSTAQDDAVVAALRTAGQPVTPMPAVSSVTVDGPAHDLLLPGDLVVAVDGVPTRDQAAVKRAIRAHRPGDEVTIRVLRERVETTVVVPTVASKDDPQVAVVRITLGAGYRYAPRISFDVGQRIGGPSAGLVFALAIYDKITPGALLDGRHVAGTGTITPSGDVGSIGGIQEKIASAEDAGAEVFLVPAANCGDLAGATTDVSLVKVATLQDAVDALQTLDQPRGADRLPRC